MADDPSAIGEWIQSLDKNQEQTTRWDEFIVDWAARDFEAALAWTKALDFGPLQDRALIHLSYAWEERDLDDLIGYITALPDGQDRLIIAISNRWAKLEPDLTASWAMALPDSNRKSGILASVVAAWASDDPASALEFISTLPQTVQFDDSKISAISAISIQEPELAAAVVETVHEGRLRNAAIENLIYHWSRKDPQAALSWIDENLSEEESDLAALAAVGAAIDEDPRISTAWANSIAKPQLRFAQLSRSLRQWISSDPAAARKWIQESDLPYQITQRYLK